MSAMPELLASAVEAHKKGIEGAAPLAAQLKDFMFEPVMEQLKNEPDTETLAALLESWNEAIGYAGEHAASKFTPAQLQASVQICQVLLQESVERRQERAKESAENEADEEEEEQLAEEARAAPGRSPPIAPALSTDRQSSSLRPCWPHGAIAVAACCGRS